MCQKACNISPVGSQTFAVRQGSLCFMFLMNADLPLIRFHVLKVENARRSVLIVPDLNSVCRLCEFHLRVWSAPAVSASLPEGWTDSDTTEPLRNQRVQMGSCFLTQKGKRRNSYSFVAFLAPYLCALMDFRHCHFFVLHTHRSPSSPPLSKWEDPENSKQVMVPVRQQSVWGRWIPSVNETASKISSTDGTSSISSLDTLVSTKSHLNWARTVMVEQSPVFHSLLHVVQLNSLIFAACDNEPLTGCYSCDGCCMGVMGEVGLRGPVLQDNRAHTHRAKQMTSIADTSNENTQPPNWVLLDKAYCRPTYFAISFYSVTESNLFVAPSNQLQHSRHAEACSDNRLSCSRLVRLVWFTSLCRLKTDKDTYWRNEIIHFRSKNEHFWTQLFNKKASSAHRLTRVAAAHAQQTTSALLIFKISGYLLEVYRLDLD